ncbi:MAG: CaiB/BaiF CoA transferase family protein [Leucobacter sp.]
MTSTSTPFTNVTVVDFSRVLAGPYATSMLADLGAEVIKVEVPNAGDDARHLGPFLDDESTYFSGLNRGKKSIEVNMKSDEDRDRLQALLRDADVVVENFRPGVAARLGIAYEDLTAINPQVVYASISGYGQTGPYATTPAYDTVVQAKSGLMDATGSREGTPTRVGESIADVSAGVHAAFGIASALYQKIATGNGAHVDVPMYDVLVAMQPTNVALVGATGSAPVRSGNAHPVTAPFDTYQAADGLVVIAVANDRLFGVLAETIGHPELAADPRFSTDTQRKLNEDDLRSYIEDALSSTPVTEAVDFFTTAGIPASEVLDLKQTLESDLGRSRRLHRRDQRNHHGFVAHPLLFNGVRPASHLPVPRLGEHNSEVLPTHERS